MSQTQQRKKLRREYLKKKSVIYIKAIVDVFSALCFAGIVWWLLGNCHYLLFGDAVYGWEIVCVPFVVIILLGASLWCGITSWRLVILARNFHREAKQLEPVPRVTTDTLLAEEVLLRGSAEPSQEQSKVLLRGIQHREDTADQELLRGSQER